MSWLPWVIAAVALVALVVWKMLAGRLGPDQIEEIRAALSDGAKLVDVRTPQEFASGHVRGAVNIPLAELPHRAGELGKHKHPLVVYCQTGSRSSYALRMLRQQGFKRVVDLKGISNHRAVGLETG